jgi:hypothetical protein
VLEHNAEVGGVESAFEVHVHDVFVFIEDFSVLHHRDNGGEGVMDVTEEAESVLLLA